MVKLLPICTVILVLLFPGCGHYQLKQPGELPFKTIFVPQIENNTFAPQVVPMLTQQIIYQLQRAQEVEVVSSEGAADVTLVVNLNEYDQQTWTTSESDTVVAESMMITFYFYVSLINNHTGEFYMWRQPFHAKREVFVQGGYQAALYQVMPVITENIAQQVRDAILTVW